MHFTNAAALAASLSLASASAIRGFNSGSTGTDGAPKQQSDFQAEFVNQKNIQGTDGEFNSCRLYTMIQGGTTSGPISAIPAAIAENTGLLLGLWASAGSADFANEVAALTNAINEYGSSFAAIAQGISVGSEDLYRISPTGIAGNEGPGAGPEVLAGYISQVKTAIAGTVLANVPVGHVDTWTAWTNSSNSAVVDAVDFIGIDEYPYYQSTDSNPISNAKNLFDQAVAATQAVAPGKPVWITEAGWPTSGATVGEAVASVANAETFWQDVYCSIPASTPVYWYIQYDPEQAGVPNFGVTGTSLSTTPAYPLSCSATNTTTTTTTTSSSSTSTSTSSSSSSSSASSSASSTSTGSGTAVLVPTTTGLSTAVSTIVSVPTSTPFPVSSHLAVTGLSSTGGSTMTTSVSSSTPKPSTTPSTTIAPATGSASNVQIYTVALLIVPALIALML